MKRGQRIVKFEQRKDNSFKMKIFFAIGKNKSYFCRLL